MDTQTSKKKRPYDGLNIRRETKLRIDEIYYRLKISKKYKSYDDLIKDILDVFENKK